MNYARKDIGDLSATPPKFSANLKCIELTESWKSPQAAQVWRTSINFLQQKRVWKKRRKILFSFNSDKKLKREFLLQKA